MQPKLKVVETKTRVGDAPKVIYLTDVTLQRPWVYIFIPIGYTKSYSITIRSNQGSNPKYGNYWYNSDSYTTLVG